MGIGDNLIEFNYETMCITKTTIGYFERILKVDNDVFLASQNKYLYLMKINDLSRISHLKLEASVR